VNGRSGEAVIQLSNHYCFDVLHFLSMSSTAKY
jgi:hypothetical protein